MTASPSSTLPDEAPPRGWQELLVALRRDVGSWALALSAVVLVTPYLFPVLPDEVFLVFAQQGAYVPVLVAVIFALLWGLWRRPRREQLFWGLIALSMVAHLVTRITYLTFENMRAGSWIDFLYMAEYGAILAASQLPPDHVTEQEGDRAPKLLEMSALAVFLVAAFVYFVTIPALSDEVAASAWVPSLAMYVTLDLVLLVSFATLARSASARRFRLSYGLLALVALGWLVTDSWETTWYLDYFEWTDGSLLDLLWYPPFLFAGLAARLHVVMSERDGVEPEPEPEPEHAAHPIILVYPLLLPAVHLIAEIFGIFDDELRREHAVVILTASVLLAVLSYTYQRLVQLRSEGLAARQREVEDRLARSQKMEALGRLAGGVAHDFNNVLQAIVGYGEFLRSDLPEHIPSRGLVDNILSAARQGKGMVAQILAFSRMRELERRPVPLQAAVQEGLALVRPMLPAGVEVHTRIESDDVIVEAEESQLLQVVTNLLGNACHAMEERGGELRVEVWTELATLEPDSPSEGARSYAVLAVVDTGSGIPPEVLDRIFDPFFTTKEIGKGTGLGLAAVRRIVTAHKGTIDVASKPESGTTFTIRLPLYEAGRADEPARQSTQPSSGTRRVMVVDDETAVAKLIERNLDLLGYEVVAYNDPKEALRAFSENPVRFDALVTDQRMPKLSGLELARSVRQIVPDLPVLLVTGYSDALQGGVVAEAGVRDVLGKPFRREELGRAVAALFGQEAAPPPTPSLR